MRPFRPEDPLPGKDADDVAVALAELQSLSREANERSRKNRDRAKKNERQLKLAFRNFESISHRLERHSDCHVRHSNWIFLLALLVIVSLILGVAGV